MSHDLVNHNKWSWFEIDGWNGKGLKKLVGFQISRLPDGKACHPAAFFPISLGNFLAIKITVKCRLLMPVTSKLKLLLISSCSFHFWYLFHTITISYDWQDHVTQLYKGPIYYLIPAKNNETQKLRKAIGEIWFMYILVVLQRQHPDFPHLTNFPTSHCPLWSPLQQSIKCLVTALPASCPQIGMQ